MATINVNVSDHFAEFIAARIADGRFSDASDVVLEGLSLLEERDREDYDEKLAWLRAAAKEGFDELDRGEGIEFETMDDLDAHIDRIGKEVSAEIAAKRRGG